MNRVTKQGHADWDDLKMPWASGRDTMPNDKPYIERRYVELEEDGIRNRQGILTGEKLWVARVNGPVTPTKERVQMSRSSKSAGEALLLLTEALAEQGWELR